MPAFYRLTGEMVLVLNNKKDAYYVTTPKTCSCPASIYNPGPCKHARTYFLQPKKSQAEIESESDALLAAHNAGGKRLARPPEESIRPVGKWPGGLNGPVDEIMGVA